MSQEIHLRDILRIFRKHRWSIAVIFSTITGIAILLNLTMTPMYEAKSKVVIDRVEPNTLTERSAATQLRDPEFFETQYQIIKSKAVAERVIDILGEKDPATMATSLAVEKKSGSRLSKWLRAVLQKAGFAAPRTDGENSEPDARSAMIKAINEKIRIRPLDNSRLVQISYLSADPRFAALVVNTVVQAYVDEITQMKTNTSRTSVAWMNRKAEGQESKLREAEAALQTYMGENEILSLENRVAVIPEKLSRISSELVTAEARRQEMETLSKRVSRVAVDPEAAESVSAVLSDQALQTLRAQIVEAEKNILELSAKYGPRHPAMQKAQGDLDILRRKKEQEIARIARSIRNQYELAALNERNLRAQFEASKTEALQMNEKFLKYQSLKAEVDNNRAILDALMVKMKEEGITGERQSVRSWTVEKASVPTVPALPKKTMNLSLGLLLGLLGGTGFALFREYLDNSIRDPDGAEAALQIPVLGTISLCRRERIEQIVLDEPLSAFAEGYKSLRTMILVGSPTRRLLVTSSLPGEGKTSTAVNLALTLAQAEKRVLLIDADLRKPRIHDIFRLQNRQGLSRLLSGTANEQELARALQPGPLPFLTVMTAGPIPPNPSELLQSGRMRELLKQLADKFDIILCDSPPVLAVEDARILSRLFGGTIVVAKAHATSLEVAGRTLKLLRGVKAPVLGFVVNGLDQRKSEDYYHLKYYSAYREKPLKIEG